MIRRPSVWGRTGTNRRRSEVSPSEGNEVRREGCQEVGALHSTDEAGEPPEGPRGGKGAPFHEPLEGNMTGTPRPDPVSTKQQRIAELARNCPDMAFTTLAHHIDIAWLREAYDLTRKDGAVGVDGQTAEDYEANLRATFRTCSTAPSPARTWPRRCDECTSPRPARLPRPARSGFRRLRTRSSSVRS